MSEETALQETPEAIQIKPNDRYFSMEKFTYMQRMAQTLLESKAMPSCYTNGSQIVAAMQYGWELGMKPMEAVRAIAPVNGRFSLHSEEAIARIKRAGWEIEYEEAEKQCTMTITKGDKKYTEQYTIEDARVAGLLNKDNWKKHPRLMLRYRAAGLHRKFNIPEVMGSFITADEAEELEPVVRASENPVDDGFGKIEEVEAKDVKVEKPKKNKTTKKKAEKKEEDKLKSLFEKPEEDKAAQDMIKKAEATSMKKKADLTVKITQAANILNLKGEDFSKFVAGAIGEKWEDANNWTIEQFETLLSALNKSIDSKNDENA